jgi:hypothetical protein
MMEGFSGQMKRRDSRSTPNLRAQGAGTTGAHARQQANPIERTARFGFRQPFESAPCWGVVQTPMLMATSSEYASRAPSPKSRRRAALRARARLIIGPTLGRSRDGSAGR